jgi:hypothetical protein
MLRRVLTCVAACLVGSALHAQGTPPNPSNENDLQLHNGADTFFFYSDPSDPTDFFWKVWPKEIMRSCSGTLEVIGLHISVADTDFTTAPGGLNTVLADMLLSKSSAAVPVNPGNIEPDLGDPNGTLISFGAQSPNNVFLTDPGCPPMGYIYGFDIDVDLSGGAGVGNGIPVVADGARNTVFTTFMPGPGFSLSAGGVGGNACGAGDYPTPDLHSTDQVPGGKGEEQFDFLGGGYSAFGGFAIGGVLGGTDLVTEVACSYLQFSESTLAMNMNSGLGQGVTEGLHGIHYNCPAGPGGSIGARLYDWSQIGAGAVVTGTLSPPLASCVNFKGGKLGLVPTDPLFNVFLGLWSGTVGQTSDTHGPPTFSVFDNGEFTTLSLPLPAQAVPVGVSVPLHFQGFTKKPGQAAHGTQITRLILHG